VAKIFLPYAGIQIAKLRLLRAGSLKNILFPSSLKNILFTGENRICRVAA
jgi:hypothetical protein